MTTSRMISITLTALVAVTCLFVVAAPVSAVSDMDVTIDPCRSPPGASPAYICVLNSSTSCDIWFVNMTIPQGYTAVDPVECGCAEIVLTLRDSTGDILSESTAFKNETGYWITVTHTTNDGVYGPHAANCGEGEVTKICEDCTACLSLTMPTAATNGALNISLGAMGPLTSGDCLTLRFASGCIKNPATSGRYTWSVTADPGGYSESSVVCIMHPGDIDGNNHVWLLDLMELADAFDSRPGDPNWDQCADLNCDGHIYLLDLMILADNFDVYY